jgi:hypothetical protein
VQRVEGVERALAAYRNSAEEQIAHEFAVQHGLARPSLGPINPGKAAEQLHRLVSDLPELRAAGQTKIVAAEPRPVEPALDAEQPGRQAQPRGELNSLTKLSKGRKLVVIGAHAGRHKDGLLPPVLAQRTEWVDTERDGVHAIGNLPQRIRQGRVAAIVILDKAIQHKHTEPLIAAARESGTAVAFAGKGGRAALARALEQLDERTREHG